MTLKRKQNEYCQSCLAAQLVFVRKVASSFMSTSGVDFACNYILWALPGIVVFILPVLLLELRHLSQGCCYSCQIHCPLCMILMVEVVLL